MRLAFLALFAVLLVAHPARAELGQAREDSPYHYLCGGCNLVWEGVSALFPIEGVAMAQVGNQDAGLGTKAFMPVFAAAGLEMVGIEIGLRLLNRDYRPIEDWVVIYVTKMVAFALSWVAGTQLPAAPAVLTSLALSAAASVPYFVLNVEQF